MFSCNRIPQRAFCSSRLVAPNLQCTSPEKKKISFLNRSFCFQNPILRDEIKEKRTKSEFQIRALRTYSCPPSGVLGVPGNPAAGCNEAAGALVAVAATGLAVCGIGLVWTDFLPD